MSRLLTLPLNFLAYAAGAAIAALILFAQGSGPGPGEASEAIA